MPWSLEQLLPMQIYKIATVIDTCFPHIMYFKICNILTRNYWRNGALYYLRSTKYINNYVHVLSLMLCRGRHYRQICQLRSVISQQLKFVFILAVAHWFLAEFTKWLSTNTTVSGMQYHNYITFPLWLTGRRAQFGSLFRHSIQWPVNGTRLLNSARSILPFGS